MYLTEKEDELLGEALVSAMTKEKEHSERWKIYSSIIVKLQDHSRVMVEII